MAAVNSQVIPSFRTNFVQHSLFISASTYGKYILSDEYFNALHEDKMRFLSNADITLW